MRKGDERFYRIDVTLMTPLGPRSGHGILRVTRFENRPSVENHGVTYSNDVEGEAIPIELARNEYVFMVVERPQLGWSMYAPWDSPSDDEALSKGVSVPFDMRFFPGFAKFSNYLDPRSVREFKVEYPGSKTTSPYKLKSIMITRTNGPSSHVVGSILPWAYQRSGDSSAINALSRSTGGSFESMISYKAFSRPR